ncbi:MAG: hypothetical protein LBU89_07710 [Fibromonadaceae bacterium]|jgi:hypothetical protein|nr:hypothetical protein [Fibromonadaceae bacterium]
MKKVLLFVTVFIAFASAQGPYFDVGFGFGEIKTRIDGKDYVKEANILLANNVNDHEGIEFSIKTGYGPFGLGIGPLYVVADLGLIEHSVFNNLYNDDEVIFTTYMFGPGVILYPISFIQIGLSAGLSVATVNMAKENIEIESDLGYMYSASVAYDFGANLEPSFRELLGNHSFLFGFKYSGSRNPTYSGKTIKMETPSFFIKYAYIHRKKAVSLSK